MQVLSKKMGAWMAVAALGTASLFAQTPPPAQHFQHQGRSGAMMAAALNLTDAQKSQMKSIFQEARQSSQPVRQQLRQTRQSLQAAVQAGNSDQIQQLSATEGTEMGQLAAIRASARARGFAKSGSMGIPVMRKASRGTPMRARYSAASSIAT